MVANRNTKEKKGNGISWDDMMKEKDPEYEESSWSYKNRIATKCRICGGQLLLPEEMKKEVHAECDKNLNSNTYVM